MNCRPHFPLFPYTTASSTSGPHPARCCHHTTCHPTLPPATARVSRKATRDHLFQSSRGRQWPTLCTSAAWGAAAPTTAAADVVVVWDSISQMGIVVVDGQGAHGTRHVQAAPVAPMETYDPAGNGPTSPSGCRRDASGKSVGQHRDVGGLSPGYRRDIVWLFLGGV